jgi:ribosome recycling factor
MPGRGEHSKVATRNIRRDAIEGIKRYKKAGLVKMLQRMQKLGAAGDR